MIGVVSKVILGNTPARLVFFLGKSDGVERGMEC